MASVDKSGIQVSSNTLTWLQVIVGMAALLGPPAAFLLSVQVASATSEVRITALERHDAILDARFDAIDARLRMIAEGVAELRGRGGVK